MDNLEAPTTSQETPQIPLDPLSPKSPMQTELPKPVIGQETTENRQELQSSIEPKSNGRLGFIKGLLDKLKGRPSSEKPVADKTPAPVPGQLQPQPVRY